MRMVSSPSPPPRLINFTITSYGFSWKTSQNLSKYTKFNAKGGFHLYLSYRKNSIWRNFTKISSCLHTSTLILHQVIHKNIKINPWFLMKYSNIHHKYKCINTILKVSKQNTSYTLIIWISLLVCKKLSHLG